MENKGFKSIKCIGNDKYILESKHKKMYIYMFHEYVLVKVRNKRTKCGKLYKWIINEENTIPHKYQKMIERYAMLYKIQGERV